MNRRRDPPVLPVLASSQRLTGVTQNGSNLALAESIMKFCRMSRIRCMNADQF
jgi:hypothetical protein